MCSPETSADSDSTTQRYIQEYGRIASYRMLGRVGLVRTDVSEELTESFVRVTRISELGTTLASSQCASVASYS
jgi:hypothetical protein